jgi:hypothetical protein
MMNYGINTRCFVTFCRTKKDAKAQPPTCSPVGTVDFAAVDFNPRFSLRQQRKINSEK